MRLLLIVSALIMIWSCSSSNETTNSVEIEMKKNISPYLFEKENTSSIRIYEDSLKGMVVETLNSKYYRHDALIGDMGERFFIEEKQLTRSFDAKGCEEGTLEMKIWRMDRDTFRLTNKIADQSVEHEFILSGHHILKTEVEDCSDATPVNHLYSLSNPTPLLTYHDDFSLLKLPKTGIIRMTGFHPHLSADPALLKYNDPGLVGYLMYSSDRIRMQMVALKCSDSTLFPKTLNHPPKTFYIAERSGNTIRMNDMDLYPDAGEDFYTVPSNFSIELNFTDLKGIDPIQIPVDNDKLQVNKAKIPKGFEIELVPVK